MRKNGWVVQWHRGVVKGCLGASTRYTQSTDLDDISHTNNKKHDPELKPLNDISTGQLEEVVLFEAFKDSALDRDELVGKKESQESVGGRVDSNVERNDLVIQCY